MVNHPTRLKTGDSPQPFLNLLPVATCRQTVEAFLARCPPLGSGWLHLAADGYAWQPMATIRPIWWILLCYNQFATPLVQTALGGVLDLCLSLLPLPCIFRF